MTTTQNNSRQDAITEALSLIEEAADVLREAGIMDEPRFRAYHAATFEGTDRGWMGRGFLIDDLRSMLDEDGEDEDVR